MSSNQKAFHLYAKTTYPLQPGSNLVCWGLTLIISGIFTFIFFVYACITSKLLVPSKMPILSALENDRYYCLLIPLTLPILVVFAYFHWLSMKLFKHA